MKLNEIRDLTNTRMAGEQLTYSALLPYFDAVIDEINSKLHTKFKTFTEINPTGLGQPDSYSCFPDKYVRTVVCVGAAYKWYIDDEEGMETATALKFQYENNLFIMLRDYGPLVPEEYKVHNESGFFKDPNNPDCNTINPDIRYIPVQGVPGDSIVNAWIDNRPDGQYLMVKILSYTAPGVTKIVDCGKLDLTPYEVSVNKPLAENHSFTDNIGFEIEDI